MSSLLLVIIASAALLVRLGQTVGAMGIARAKNVASAGFRSLADLCIATLAFWAVGAAILFQDHNPIFAIRVGDLIGWSRLSPNWFSMLVAVLISTGIIGPALSERSKQVVPLKVGGLLAIFLVPLIGHWTWRGWLYNLGFTDVAGAGAIHLTAAVCAATAVLFVGPRDGKYNRDGSSNMIPGHSVLLILLSVTLMLIGWTPYILMMDPSADASQVAANVLISAAAGGLASLITSHIRYGKADVMLTCAGILGGLVAITAGGSHFGTPAAFVCGCVAGIVIPYMIVTIDLRWKIDDPGGVIAIHGIGGAWALIAAAIFHPVPAAARLKILGVNLLGILAIILVAAIFCSLRMIILRKMTGLRSKEADEYDGLDLAEHDINAHPDFQQTMIKSYHLREA